MKRKIIYFTVMISMLSFYSCSKDFTETPQKAVISLDNYFTNLDECQSFVGGLYKSFAAWEDWTQSYVRFTNEMSTDDAWMGNLNQSSSANYAFAFYTITASNAPWPLTNYYASKYVNILACNVAINKLPNTSISDDNKNKLIGQAKFFRAFSYWELVQNFGDVVLTKDVMSTSQLNKERSPKDSVYAAIVADLKDAASKLPATWTGNDVGRVTKGACKALLARTYLFMKDYKNAFAYADTVIKSGNYSLEPKFVNIWSCTNHNGVESIFESQTSSNQSYAVGNQFPVVLNARGEKWATNETSKAMDGWGWCVPTSNLEKAYKSEGDSIRLKSTIIRLGLPVYGDSIDNPHYRFDSTLNKSCRTWRKMYVPIAIRQSLTAKDGHVPLDMILLRLGEMYLIRAEAAYFLSQPDQALADINTLRARVNLPAKTGLTGNNLLYAIWKERRLELANEGIRLYDLRREIDPVANKKMIDVVMGTNGTFVQYNATSTDYWEKIHTKEPSDKGSAFIEGKHELWPIPQSEIDRSNGKVTQNPGY
ncbi:MAG: RagB/SusD family nutrient uptake outer membrane protein [Bacteroidota bacterium]|nr:RagB/SusD family nutrient uptake outer membrane protein [Bacteroidota bacterium]